MNESKDLEIENLKEEITTLKKELGKYKDTNNSSDNEFISQNLEVLIQPIELLNLSVRTLNCLKNENINNLGDLIQVSESYLLKSRNFGRKSLNEIKEIILSHDLEFGTRIDEWPPENYENKIEILKKQEISKLEVDPDSFLDELDNLLAKDSELIVIKRRFWKFETLNKIGIDLNVTRERVRQIEAKALRKIKIVKKNYVLSFLNRNKDKIFNKYSENTNIITHHSLRKIISREKLPRMISLITDFDALINLCIKINYESIHKYFDKEHQIIENGWKKI